MAYMAVGSRHILFSDASVPAAPRYDVREVANLSDNTPIEATREGASPEVRAEPATPSPQQSPPPVEPGRGENVDVSA